MPNDYFLSKWLDTAHTAGHSAKLFLSIYLIDTLLAFVILHRMTMLTVLNGFYLTA